MKLNNLVIRIRQVWVELIETRNLLTHDIVNTQNAVFTLTKNQAIQVRNLEYAITQAVQNMEHGQPCIQDTEFLGDRSSYPCIFIDFVQILLATRIEVYRPSTIRNGINFCGLHIFVYGFEATFLIVRNRVCIREKKHALVLSLCPAQPDISQLPSQRGRPNSAFLA